MDAYKANLHFGHGTSCGAHLQHMAHGYLEPSLAKTVAKTASTLPQPVPSNSYEVCPEAPQLTLVPARIRAG